MKNQKLGGNPTGILEGIRGYPTPDIARENHCPKSCMYYRDQRHLSEIMQAIFGSSGRWNYAKCFYFCPLRLGTSQAMSDKRRKSYNKYQVKYRAEQKLKKVANANISI